MSEYRKKLIEVAMPLVAINRESAREKSIRHGHPSTLHLWWARRPLATCRAVIFGQLVDDPSSWPERFPTEEEQDAERRRLFGIIEELVLWANTNNTRVINAARNEIAQSLARNRVADGEGTERDDEVLVDRPAPSVIDSYLDEVAPPVHDPFAGGGSIPMEAQRLGLRAIATDLNPVAVLINKAQIEIPPKFAGREPVHSEAEQRMNWSGAEGLAEDVLRFGEWMRNEAHKRIAHLYPEVDLPEEHGGGKATVIAWLWARTVESPDPAFNGVLVPLVSNFFLSTKKDREVWVEHVIEGRSYRFEIRTGKPENPAEIRKGTRVSKGTFKCLMSGTALTNRYIREQAMAGRLGSRLMAVVAEGNRKRIYLDPTEDVAAVADVSVPESAPTAELPDNPRYMAPPLYGLTTYADLFTPRQLVVLTTFSDLVQEAREKAIVAARGAGWEDDGLGLENGGCRATAYGDAIAIYLAFALSRSADRGSTICTWDSSPKMEALRNTFGRQALPMTWDFAEGNPFSNSSGNFRSNVTAVSKSLAKVPGAGRGIAAQQDAVSALELRSDDLSCPPLVTTDPPYYDNIGYADLSDFFYVWLRRGLKSILPDLFSTLLVPKAEELVASPYRHGGNVEAENFFLSGMTAVMASIATHSSTAGPIGIYYAFKQSETKAGGTSSTGWETFLDALLRSGLAVVGTWPVRTELGNKIGVVAGKGANMLASSIVLVCQPRHSQAQVITRGDFRRILLDELPSAIHALQKGSVAPVDMSQASIGPGMAVFSRHAKVIEADGSTMSVRTALQLINEVVDEVCSGEESDLDRETRFAVAWFVNHGFAPGPYGDSETLANAMNVSVSAVVNAGVLQSAANKTRLLTRAELPQDWDPSTDATLTVWECTQHLIKRLEERGESAAAELLRAIGPRVDAARSLAYRLYTHCERKGDSDEARAFNGLVVAWAELERLAGTSTGSSQPNPVQSDLYK